MALMGILCLIAMYIYISWRAPVKPWGDVSQAIMYHQSRKWLLKMDQTDGGQLHTKYWRPSVLLLADDLQMDLVKFCDYLKKGGLLVVGNVVVGDVPTYAETAQRLQASWLSYIRKHKVKAFPQVLVAPTLRDGYQFLLQGSGLGGLTCNTLAVPLYDPKRSKLENKIGARSSSFYDDVSESLSRGDEPTRLAATPTPSPQRKVVATESSGASSGAASGDGETKQAGGAGESEEKSEQQQGGNCSEDGRTAIDVSISAERGVERRTVTGNLPMTNASAYVETLRCALQLRKNVMVACGFGAKRSKPLTTTYGTGAAVDPFSLDDIEMGDSALTAAVTQTTASFVDVWVDREWHHNSFGDTTALMVQLANILTLRARAAPKGASGTKGAKAGGGAAKLRVLLVVPETCDDEARAHIRSGIEMNLKTARITDAVVLLVDAPHGLFSWGSNGAYSPGPKRDDDDANRSEAGVDAAQFNAMVAAASADTAQTFIALPNLPSSEDGAADPESATRYLRRLNVMTAGLPETVLVMAGEPGDMITTAI